VTIRFEIGSTTEALRLLEAAIRNVTVQAVRATVQDAEDHAKRTTLFRDRTGTLRRSIRGSASGYEGEVRANAPYATYVENGSPPREITPRGGGALRFEMNGQTVFAKRVQHPGSEERPFMQQARDHGEKVLEYGLDYSVDFAIQKFNG
jgi:bacteriophage HK97-gp10 putative tail-component